MSNPDVAYKNEREVIDYARGDALGGVVTRFDFQVPSNFVPAPADLDFKTLERKLFKLKGKSERYVITRIDAWPALVMQEEEGTTGLKVTTTKTFHDTAPNIGTNGTGRFVESVKQISTRLWAKIVREIHADVLTTTWQEYHPVEYRFPPYLDEVQPFIILEIASDRKLINTLRSSPQRLKIPCLFEITYSETVPVISDVFQFKPVDITIRTADGTLDERGVLTDGATVFISVAANMTLLNSQYAGGAITSEQFLAALRGYEVSFAFPASSPSTTQYKALMGTNVLIADDVTRWKFNLYRRVKVWMKMPDLATNLDGSLTY